MPVNKLPCSSEKLVKTTQSSGQTVAATKTASATAAKPASIESNFDLLSLSTAPPKTAIANDLLGLGKIFWSIDFLYEIVFLPKCFTQIVLEIGLEIVPKTTKLYLELSQNSLMKLSKKRLMKLSQKCQNGYEIFSETIPFQSNGVF